MKLDLTMHLLHKHLQYLQEPENFCRRFTQNPIATFCHCGSRNSATARTAIMTSSVACSSTENKYAGKGPSKIFTGEPEGSSRTQELSDMWSNGGLKGEEETFKAGFK